MNNATLPESTGVASIVVWSQGMSAISCEGSVMHVIGSEGQVKQSASQVKRSERQASAKWGYVRRLSRLISPEPTPSHLSARQCG